VGLVFLAGGVAATAPEAARPARPLLERVRSQLAGRAGLRAEFDQVSEWAALGETDTSRGTLAITTSGLFRLDYQQPPGQRIGCDGARVWTFVPEERQVIRARVGQTTGWSGLFLESLGDPLDSLVVPAIEPGWGPVARIALRPRSDWDLAELHVEVAVDPGLPVGYGYTDREGNRIRFRFRAAHLVASFPDTLFRFRVPPGYELFETD
jgi:outer membrane lipoprotein-sorting protein